MEMNCVIIQGEKASKDWMIISVLQCFASNCIQWGPTGVARPLDQSEREFESFRKLSALRRSN